MSPEIAYFVKVNIACMLFYAFYRLFFYKDTFFKLRRTVLLTCFGLAIAYPLFNIQEWIREQEPISGVILMYSALLPAGEVTTEQAAAIDWQRLFLTVGAACYRLVAALLVLRFVMQLGRILWLAFKSKRAVVEGEPVYVLDKPSGPFSFFGMIFLCPALHSPKEIKEILTHERTHASQWHSLDVIVSEAFCIACWMNPFVWLLKREVRHNLEYLADNMVLKSGFDSKSYQYHLLGLAHFNQAAANLYNNFNVLHLKNRIRMMNKKRSRAIGRTKYLIFLPLTALLMLFSNAEAIARMMQQDKPVQQDKQRTVFAVVEEMPQFPGGESEMLRYVASQTKYPAEAQAKKVEGRVTIQFVINDDGSISDAQVVGSIDPSLDAEALRVVRSMPQWTPGKQRGQAVAVRYILPVTFKLPGQATAGRASSPAPAKTSGAGGEVDAATVFTIVEEMPRFPGGDQALVQFLNTQPTYPQQAQQAGIQGRVTCTFVIEKDGSVSSAKVVRSVDPLLDAEALRVVRSMPRWTPGKQRDQAVRVSFTVPVTFALSPSSHE
jgi:TonB family protein